MAYRARTALPLVLAAVLAGTTPGVPQTTTPALRMHPYENRGADELPGGAPAALTDPERRGWEAYQRGDVEAALAVLDAVAANPDAKAWVLYVTGLSRMALDEPRQAALSWERVRRLAPEFSPVYLDLASAYLRASDLEHAYGVLKDARSRWPSNAEFHNAIGVLHTGRGALDAALESFRKAAEAAPDDPLLHLNLGLAYEMRLERSRRSVTAERDSAQRWTAEESDRRGAAESFQRSLALGGPYAAQAAAGLARVRGTARP